jgi:flagellar basal body rod protein FlgC
LSLNGIAISLRGALAQMARIEAVARNVANLRTGTIDFSGRLEAVLSSSEENGQRVGEDGQLGGADGQWGGTDSQGWGKNGQLVGVEEGVARAARRGDVLGGNRRSPVLESAELIRALRALEANLQAIRIQDAVLERTVNEFARPAK